MEDQKTMREAAEQLCETFQLPMKVDRLENVESWLQWLQARLEERMTHLLQKNHQELTQILYRVDIPEEAIQEVFQNTVLTEIPSKRATLVIERQLQKIELRRKWSEQFSPYPK